MGERQIVKAGMYAMTLASFLMNALGLARAVLINHHYGAENYGIIATAYGVPFLIALFFVDPDAYVNYFLPRTILRSRADTAQMIWIACVLRTLHFVLSGGCIILLAAPLAHLSGHPEIESLVVLSGWMYLFANAFSGPFQGAVTNAFQLHRETFWQVAFKAAGSFAVAAACYVGDLGLSAFFILRIFENLGFGFYSFWISWKQRAWLSLGTPTRPWQTVTWEALKFSFPISVNRNLMQGYQSALTLLLTRFLGFEIVGNVKLIYNLAERISTTSASFLKILTVTLAKAPTEKEGFLRFSKILLNMNFVYLTLAGAMGVFSVELCRLFAGRDFLYAPRLCTLFFSVLYLLQILSLLLTFLISLGYTYLPLTINVARAAAVSGLLYLILGSGGSYYWLPGLELASLAMLFGWAVVRSTGWTGWRKYEGYGAVVLSLPILLAAHVLLLLIPTTNVGQEGYLISLGARTVLGLGLLYWAYRVHRRYRDFELVRDLEKGFRRFFPATKPTPSSA